jgi:RNA polymerase sigma-70 factor (ECF subfamily)
MRKNWLGRVEAAAVQTEDEQAAAAAAHEFEPAPLVDDEAFQSPDEPYPGHWRAFPEPWPTGSSDGPAEARAVVEAALDELPETWRQVLTRRDAQGQDDEQVADALDLTLDQERRILARARAAIRDRLDEARDRGEWR